MAVLVAGLMLSAVAAGCSSSEASSDDAPVTTEGSEERFAVAAADLVPFEGIEPEDVAGPGSAIGAGLTVPEGSVLLGVPFPDLVGGGFRALLLVTGHPVAVHDSLARQAAGLGMSGHSACLGSADVTGCTGSYADPADGEAFDFAVTRTIGQAGVVSGVGLQYRPPGSVQGPFDDPAPVAPTAPIAEAQLPPTVAPANPFDVAQTVRSPGAPKRIQERGSTVVGLPGPCACAGPGWSFVVRLDGVPRDVIAGYGRQLSDLGEVPDMDDRHRDDETIIGLRVGEGDTVGEVRAVLTDHGNDYAIVTVRPG